MTITDAISGMTAPQGRESSDSQETDRGRIASEFERIFARQMVEQMTKNLFNDEQGQGVMQSGGSLYKEQLIDILSTEFGNHEALGIAEIVRTHWQQRNGAVELSRVAVENGVERGTSPGSRDTIVNSSSVDNGNTVKSSNTVESGKTLESGKIKTNSK